MVTTDAFFVSFDVNDEHGCVRAEYHEGAHGFALQLIAPIVVGRVDIASNLDVRIVVQYLVVEVTFVTLLHLTQGLDYRGFSGLGEP